MKPAALLRLARSHRLLGMMVTVPLLGWIASSFVLHGVALALPNGLQGVYELEPFHAGDVVLEEEALVPPGAILAFLERDGLRRVYWLRLEVLAGRPAYVIKPGPFDLERVYDARTGIRLDPLGEEMLAAIAAGELVDTDVARLERGDEFNRYYTLGRVPAVSAVMTGAQPSELVLSQASGRTLRRTDALAGWFHRAYLSVHVWQWGESLRLFTAVLYGLVGLSLALVTLGYVLWFQRREARRRWTEHARRDRRIHARLAPVAGLILATQMLVGAYLWFNLGLIEPRFRGQGSFREAWTGGIEVGEHLASAREIASFAPPGITAAGRPIQRFEWRAAGEARLWLVYPSRTHAGVLLDAASGQPLDRLSPEAARTAAEGVVLGQAAGPPAEATEYWMDANVRVPTYRFRFTDPDASDVHVSQLTGEVIQRRPAIWRAFGPFLAYHTFGFTGNPWLDTLLLTALQAILLAMMVTGWRLALSRGS